MNTVDTNYPSFVYFPHHTDRTAWRPFGLPMILVVPHVRDSEGRHDANADVQSVRIYISEKGKAPVAGHDHIGMFIPDYNVYSQTVSGMELRQRVVSAGGMTFLDSNGEETTRALAVSVRFQCRAGVVGTIKNVPNADYIDLSDIAIPTEQLHKDRYILNYEADYFSRSISDNNELLCILPDKISKAIHRFLLNHPGEILLMMVENTPGMYFGEAKRSEDKTIAFYRPFSDILQDAHDEQNYLERANWVYDIPHEHIPYLGFLLGWELPYFPRSVDALRRAVLRNIVKLQKLKGSKRAVRELFDLFGFAVKIQNVWWTPDGKKFAAPGEILKGNASQYKIALDQVVTTEPLIANYQDDGFGGSSIPLGHTAPHRKLTLRAYVVEADSEAHTFLSGITNTLSDDFGALDYTPPSIYTTLDSDVADVESLDGLVGRTTAFVDNTGHISILASVGDAPILKGGVKVDFVANMADVTLGKYFQFSSDDTRLYVFATYVYDKITVPTSMANLQSNRFDVEITKKDSDQVDPDVVLFLVDFLLSVKAFHSLLRKVIITMLVDETYLVTDFCVGGQIEQDISTDAGQQQVPPNAIVPAELSEGCAHKPADYGFRRWDLDYRNRILAGIKEEFEAWKAIALDCEANPYGQNRSAVGREQTTTLVDGVRVDGDAPRETLCETDGTPHCYLGRAGDSAAYKQTLNLGETWRFKGCEMGMGSGVYYTYPAPGFLGNSTINPYLGGLNKELTNSWLGRLYISYGRNQSNSLHFNTDRGFGDSDKKHKWLALARPSLNIQRDNLGFPGHRLPTMHALLDDFTHTEWKLKPWDFPIDCKCNGPRYQNPLNARLYEGTDGNQLPYWDDSPYAILGNGLAPDITTLGGHNIGDTFAAVGDAEDVTQAIYAEIGEGFPGVTLENVVAQAGVIDVVGDAFTSASDCAGGQKDYSDGYPATTGWLSSSITSFSFFPSSSDSAALATALGCPTTSWTATILYKLSSQIKVTSASHEYDYYRHLRLDCGCLSLECGTNPSILDSSVGGCTVASFLEAYGQSDNDQVDVAQYLVANERIDASSLEINNPLSSLFALKQVQGSSWELSDVGGQGPTAFPSSGEFTYKDFYGTIYEVNWDTTGLYLDIMTTTKEPRVWGSAHSGRLVNREVYRTGTVTVTRQVYINDDGNWRLIAQGSEQSVKEFKTTYLCNPPFTDPFLHNLNHPMQDAVGYHVSEGPHWTSPEDVTSGEVIWCGPSGPGAGQQALTWMNIFS